MCDPCDPCVPEVGHLKSYEAEAIQLRGVTNELQKALRASAREMEHLKVREKILEEEIRGLKKAPTSRQVGSVFVCVCPLRCVSPLCPADHYQVS